MLFYTGDELQLTNLKVIMVQKQCPPVLCEMQSLQLWVNSTHKITDFSKAGQHISDKTETKPNFWLPL